jgi:mannose-6-phosphate isomerase
MIHHDPSTLSPLTFHPIYVKTIWGGTGLKDHLNKDIPDGVPIGESWEISGVEDKQSYVNDGPFNGMSLNQLCSQFGESFLGTSSPKCQAFPLLFKFIDAHDRLSIQVHPTDSQAVANGWGTRGKTECWYVVHAEPDAKIIIGFKEGVTRADIDQGIRNNTLEALLNSVDISQGDVLFIPAGTVHAIMKGTLLYEIQEASDTTFRLYDWGRVDKNGVSRPLHIQHSLKVLDTVSQNGYKIEPVSLFLSEGLTCSIRVACRYFAVEEYTCKTACSFTIPARESFHVLAVLTGAVILPSQNSSCAFSKGASVCIPAACGETTIEAESGTTILCTWIPACEKEIIAPLRKRNIPDMCIEQLGGPMPYNDLAPLLRP